MKYLNIGGGIVIVILVAVLSYVVYRFNSFNRQREIYKGCIGKEVLYLQGFLKEKGYDIKENGYFGADTENALMDYLGVKITSIDKLESYVKPVSMPPNNSNPSVDVISTKPIQTKEQVINEITLDQTSLNLGDLEGPSPDGFTMPSVRM